MRYKLKIENMPEINEKLLYDQLKDYGFFYIKNVEGVKQLYIRTKEEITDFAPIIDIIENHKSLDADKANKIKQIKEEASCAIFAQYPMFKQINVANGLESAEFETEMKAFINSVKAKVDELETSINAKKKKETIEEVKFEL